MLEPTIVAWVLVLFGAITCLPLFFAQLTLLLQPRGRRARDLLIGKGEEWRDGTHFRSALALAWADWLIFLPLLAAGSAGVLMGTTWGYVLWGTAGAVSLYINVALWVLERDYVLPAAGVLRYFTYYWGFFVYWGAAAFIYSLVRLVSVI